MSTWLLDGDIPGLFRSKLRKFVRAVAGYSSVFPAPVLSIGKKDMTGIQGRYTSEIIPLAGADLVVAENEWTAAACCMAQIVVILSAEPKGKGVKEAPEDRQRGGVGQTGSGKSRFRAAAPDVGSR